MTVTDANVIVRVLRSRNGASNRILRGMLAGEIDFALSPAVGHRIRRRAAASGSARTKPVDLA